MNQELEWQTRRERINTKLTALNPCWNVIKYSENLDTSKLDHCAVEEFPTDNGPADYALFVKVNYSELLSKVSVNPQNVLANRLKGIQEVFQAMVIEWLWSAFHLCFKW
jgi:type I restriction enzyme R subunit